MTCHQEKEPHAHDSHAIYRYSIQLQSLIFHLLQDAMNPASCHQDRVCVSTQHATQVHQEQAHNDASHPRNHSSPIPSPQSHSRDRHRDDRDPHTCTPTHHHACTAAARQLHAAA